MYADRYAKLCLFVFFLEENIWHKKRRSLCADNREVYS